MTRVLAVALLAAGLLTVGAPARATGTAPMTTPDTITTYASNTVFPDVLANDVDAEGDDLVLCVDRAPETYRQLRYGAEPFEPRPYVVVDDRARPGTYTFTYYACDGTSRTPGTLTVVVVETPAIAVRAVRHAVGRVRVTSQAPFRVLLVYRDPRAGPATQTVRVRPHSSVVFATPRDQISWIARRLDGTFLRRGHVYDIQ